jgi:hypothetical protein
VRGAVLYELVGFAGISLAAHSQYHPPLCHFVRRRQSRPPNPSGMLLRIAPGVDVLHRRSKVCVWQCLCDEPFRCWRRWRRGRDRCRLSSCRQLIVTQRCPCRRALFDWFTLRRCLRWWTANLGNKGRVRADRSGRGRRQGEILTGPDGMDTGVCEVCGPGHGGIWVHDADKIWFQRDLHPHSRSRNSHIPAKRSWPGYLVAIAAFSSIWHQHRTGRLHSHSPSHTPPPLFAS